MRSRRIYFMILCIFFTVSFYFLPVEAAGQSGAVIQQITADSRTSRTVIWLSGRADDAQMEYRPAGGTSEKVWAQCEKISAAREEIVFRHMAYIQGLKPELAYEYRIKTGPVWSAWYPMLMDTGKPFKAIIFPDSQCVNYDVWKKTAKLAYQRNQDAAFFVNMGDLVDNGEHWYQWKEWLDGVRGMAERIPFAPVMGNHEAYSLEWNFTPPLTYLQLFSPPANGPEGFKGQVYSYDYGEVHFAVLNTQLEELADYQPDLLEQQVSWLAADLAQTKKPWKIVFMHKPVYGYPEAEAPTALGEALMPIFENLQVDVVLYAHLHCYCRTGLWTQNRLKRHQPVYICTGRSGDDAWNGRKRAKSDQMYFDLMEQPNYLILEAANNRLELCCFTQDGAELDRFILEKRNSHIQDL